MATSRKKNTKKTHRKKQKIFRKRKKNTIFTDIKLFIGLLIVSLVIFSSFFLLFYSIEKVDGYGMLPTLRNRDTIIVRKRAKLKRFDLVYVNNGLGGEFRRIIGLPGEKIEIKEDILLVNNEPIDEKYLINKINEFQIKGQNFTENFSFNSRNMEEIPKGFYLVLGDNRPYTTDSRDYGLVSSEKIKGKASILLFPLDRSEIF